MESYSIVIVLLAVVIGLLPIASKIQLPYPILLLSAGMAVGFIPGIHHIAINPEVVFLIFLPPMLYDAAYHISFKDFRTNLHTISALAISLIFVTTAGIAVIAYFLIPGISWPLAFLLGAILSPPDAIAASGVTKGLGLPHRTLTILEGESLVNDASALVAFKFAVMAVAGSSFIFWKAGLMFLISLAGGAFIGIIISFLLIFIAGKRVFNNQALVSLNLLLPFVAYLLAETFHVSGVIAVVASGLIISGHKEKFTRLARQQIGSIWDSIIFLLGGLIFILIGLQFPHVLKNIEVASMGKLILCAFSIFLAALFIRMFFIFWDKKNIDKRIAIVKAQEASMLEKGHLPDKLKTPETHKNSIRANPWTFANKRRQIRMQRKLNYFKHLKPLTTKECIIIGWSGMRGIVSLAAALSLPLWMANGNAFPERNTIIFVTVVTVVFMLLIQGLGLPLLVKILKMHDIETESQKP